MDCPETDRELLDALPDPVIAVDDELRVVRWNLAAAALYGFSREEALGRPAPALLRTRLPVELAEIRASLAAIGAWEGTVLHRDRDGVEVAVESRWSLRRAPDGSAIGVVWIERPSGEPPPPTPHHREHLADLAESVAHDFNNLLAVIVNYAVLIGGELDAAHRGSGEARWALLGGDVGEIRLAAERAARLTRRLLAAVHDEDDEAGVELIGQAADTDAEHDPPAAA